MFKGFPVLTPSRLTGVEPDATRLQAFKHVEGAFPERISGVHFGRIDPSYGNEYLFCGDEGEGFLLKKSDDPFSIVGQDVKSRILSRMKNSFPNPVLENYIWSIVVDHPELQSKMNEAALRYDRRLPDSDTQPDMWNNEECLAFYYAAIESFENDFVQDGRLANRFLAKYLGGLGDFRRFCQRNAEDWSAHFLSRLSRSAHKFPFDEAWARYALSCATVKAMDPVYSSSADPDFLNLSAYGFPFNTIYLSPFEASHFSRSEELYMLRYCREAMIVLSGITYHCTPTQGTTHFVGRSGMRFKEGFGSKNAGDDERTDRMAWLDAGFAELLFVRLFGRDLEQDEYNHLVGNPEARLVRRISEEGGIDFQLFVDAAFEFIRSPDSKERMTAFRTLSREIRQIFGDGWLVRMDRLYRNDRDRFNQIAIRGRLID